MHQGHDSGGLPVTLVHANFCELPEVLGQLDVPLVDGVLQPDN